MAIEDYVFNWNNVNVAPAVVISGEAAIISVDVNAKDVLFDKDIRVVTDSRRGLIIPKSGNTVSRHSGEEINAFVERVG